MIVAKPTVYSMLISKMCLFLCKYSFCIISVLLKKKVKLKEHVNICRLIYWSVFGLTFAIERNGSTFWEIAEKVVATLKLTFSVLAHIDLGIWRAY